MPNVTSETHRNDDFSYFFSPAAGDAPAGAAGV